MPTLTAPLPNQQKSFSKSITVPTGTVQTFGDYGIAYIVGEPVETLADGDTLVSIQLVESGEFDKYKLSQLLHDPKAK